MVNKSFLAFSIYIDSVMDNSKNDLSKETSIKKKNYVLGREFRFCTVFILHTSKTFQHLNAPT